MVEPLQHLYLPWLKPLVEAPESRYHLRDWDELTSWEPTRYILDGLLPKDLGTAGITRNCNSSLLIIANLAEENRRYNLAEKNLAALRKKILHLATEMQAQAGFHAYGPVRILIWLPDHQKLHLLPKTLAYRGSYSLRMEMNCHIEEIVRVEGGVFDKQRRRPDFLDIESSIRVLTEMKQRNIHISPSRQGDIQQRAQKYLKSSASAKIGRHQDPQENAVAIPRGWHREMEQLEKDFGEHKFSQHIVDASVDARLEAGTPRNTHRLPAHTPEYHRLVELQRNLRHNQKNGLFMEGLFQEQSVIDSLELDIFSGEFDMLERETKLREFKYLNERFKTRLEQLSTRVRDQFMYHRADRRALAQHPPLLMWDRRTAEPLVAHEHEVIPKSPLSLLDFQPHPPNLYPMTSDQRIQFSIIMGALFMIPHQNIYALDAIAPGAFNAIEPHVPALRDPHRGGHHDLSLLETQMLTREMAHGIVKAWDEWMFKPGMANLLSKATLDDPEQSSLK